MTTISPKTIARSRAVSIGVGLFFLLIPIAMGALWTANYGSHGEASICLIDKECTHATFIYEGYHLAGLDIRSRTFELKTGKQVSQNKVQGVCLFDGSYVLARLEPGSFKLYQWNKLPPSSEPIVFSIPTEGDNRPEVHGFIDGMMVASEATAESTRIMLVDPQTSTVIDEVEESGSLLVYPWQRTSFIELMRANGNGQVRRLLRIDGQKIVIGSAYNNLQYVSATDEAGQCYLFSSSADGKGIEVQSGASHDLPTTLALSEQVTNPVVMVNWSGPSWVSIATVGARIPVKTLDFHTGQELPVPAGWVLCDRNAKSKTMVVTPPVWAATKMSQAKLIDEQTGAVIADIASGRVIGTKFSPDGKQITVAYSDQRVLQIDARSGEVLHVVAPYWFIPLLEILPSFAFFGWCCLWLRFSAAIHRHAWIDCAIITGLCVGYIFLRSRMIGFPFDATRPIYQLSEGVFASWLVITSLWLILGRTRLSLRILPQIGIVGMISLIGLLCIGLQNPRVWELVIATVLLCLWLTIVFVPFRFMGYRFVFVQPLEPPVTGQIQPVEKLTRGAIPMRDLFLLTTVLAGMCALGRLAPPGLQLTVRMVIDLFVLVFAITFTALAAVRLALGPNDIKSGIVGLLAVAVVGMLMPFLWMTVYSGWKALVSPDMPFFYWELRLHASTALATSLCLYAFRLRGWRLTRQLQTLG